MSRITDVLVRASCREYRIVGKGLIGAKDLRRPCDGDHVIFMSAPFRYQNVVPPISLVEMRALGINATRTIPDLCLLRQLSAGFQINLKEMDLGHRPRCSRAVHVCAAIVIKVQAGIDALEVKVNGVTPLIGPDVLRGDEEILTNVAISRLGMDDISADHIDRALVMSDSGSV